MPTAQQRREIRRWIKGLRHQDREEATEQQQREELLGSLATGGRGGLAPGVRSQAALSTEEGQDLLEEQQ